jgi:hypothetical protein
MSITISNYIKVDRNKIDHENFRTAGAEHVSLNGAERLGLLDTFRALGLTENKAKLALASLIACMVHPSSERETFRWIKQTSSLSDLLDVDIQSEYCLYKISDFI